AARRPGGDHQRHDRAGREHQHQRDEQKRGEQVPVHGAYASPSSSLSRSTETTRSSSAVLSTITPCVERPAMRIPATGVRISLPWSVTIMIWSASSTGKDATSRPVLPRIFFEPFLPSRIDMATMPLPPRLVMR